MAGNTYVDGFAAGRWIDGFVLRAAVGSTAPSKSSCGRRLHGQQAIDMLSAGAAGRGHHDAKTNGTRKNFRKVILINNKCVLLLEKLEMTPSINQRLVKVHLRPAVGLTAGRSYVDGRAAGRWIDMASCETKPVGVLVICF